MFNKLISLEQLDMIYPSLCLLEDVFLLLLGLGLILETFPWFNMHYRPDYPFVFTACFVAQDEGSLLPVKDSTVVMEEEEKRSS